MCHFTFVIYAPDMQTLHMDARDWGWNLVGYAESLPYAHKVRGQGEGKGGRCKCKEFMFVAARQLVAICCLCVLLRLLRCQRKCSLQ